jgi:putative flippase GtrA
MSERPAPAHPQAAEAPATPPRLRMLRKATVFAFIGLINTGVDAGVFFLVLAALSGSVTASAIFGGAGRLCGCGSAHDLMLIASNMTSWLVAVTGSYVMNSTITFAAESGRRLTLRAYATFVVSGVLGLIGNTATLVLVAQVAPVWVAKICAILVSFILNFTMSHYVVFRAHRPRR